MRTSNTGVSQDRARVLPPPCWPAGAVAQDYPTKPIRMIVPYPPGGGTDIVARILNEAADRGSARRSSSTTRAAPPATSAPTSRPSRRRTATPSCSRCRRTRSTRSSTPSCPSTSRRDFAPVSLAAMIPQILVAHPSRAGEQRAGADRATPKANPGKLNYASVGNGSPGHIAGELFKLKTGIDIVHVPYKGGGPAVTDTLGGQVQFLFVSIPAAWQHVKSGKLKALARDERQAQRRRARRADASPSRACPTTWSTRGTACSCRRRRRRRRSRKLQRGVVSALQTPEVKREAARAGRRSPSSTPAEFDARREDELKKWEHRDPRREDQARR